MLPKPSRLNLKKDFKWVAAGQKLNCKFMRIFIRAGDNQTAKVGIATSSKTFRKSSERNRARRLASFAFEQLYSRLPSAINIVALPKSSILSVKSQDVLLDVEDSLKNAKIIN